MYGCIKIGQSCNICVHIIIFECLKNHLKLLKVKMNVFFGAFYRILSRP